MLKARSLIAGITASLVLGHAPEVTAQSPTFAKDIAPLLYTHCASCHRPDGDAPFSLISYDEVRRHATQIADVTKRRYMPPWKPDERGTFLGERHLTDANVAMIERWVAA